MHLPRAVQHEDKGWGVPSSAQGVCRSAQSAQQRATLAPLPADPGLQRAVAARVQRLAHPGELRRRDGKLGSAGAAPPGGGGGGGGGCGGQHAARGGGGGGCACALATAAR